MSIKNKIIGLAFKTLYIIGGAVEWLKGPIIEEGPRHDEETAAERKRKRKEAFRAAQSDAYRSKHSDYRRRSTDIKG